MKCIHCGSRLRPLFLKIKDGRICSKCFKELGFDLRTVIYTSTLYSYDDIKDGYEAMLNRRHKDMLLRDAIDNVSVSSGLHKELNATDNERKAYRIIKQILDDNDYDTSFLQLVRRSDSYVTIDAFGSDLCRLRFGPKAQWIVFPWISNDRHVVEDISRLPELEDFITKSYDYSNKYK